MSIRLLSATFAALLLPGFAGAINDDEEHPFVKAKVGDWVTYTMSANAGGTKLEGSIKMLVAAKDGKTATLKTVAILNGMEAPVQETKIELTKPYDPIATAMSHEGFKVKVEKKEEARDKATVGGKEHNCIRTKVKIKAEGMGEGLAYDATIWLSKEVPLGGLVKMEMKCELFDITLELKESGSEKK